MLSGRKEDSEAFEWCTRAAEGGHVDAHYALGIMWDQGLGVDVNPEKALNKCGSQLSLCLLL